MPAFTTCTVTPPLPYIHHTDEAVQLVQRATSGVALLMLGACAADKRL